MNFFNPAYLSIGSLCTSAAGVWNTVFSQFFGFFLGPSGIATFAQVVNFGTTFCNSINFQRINPLG